MRLALVLILTASALAHAAPPEPSGPHPRMLLDAQLKAAWKAQAAAERGPVIGAIRLCTEATETREHDNAVYQGSEWAKVLQACLVAWAATDKPEHAKTAIKYFTALLADLDKIGDKLGGDKAATRDSGYAIRNLGPYPALAYDWLHDAPGMTPALRQRARQRWAAWLTWYRDSGYRARVAGSNYQSGFLAAATLIAIAQGGEASEEKGPKTGAFVADELCGKDMTAALASGGILDGGDWPEGWQYGPLAIAHYALAARVARANGITVEGIEPWLASVLRRHIYALSPGDRVYAGQDTEEEQANLAPHVLTLDAVALGDAKPEDKAWAKGELSRLKLVDRDYLLYDALASVGDKPALAPRDKWPTWYASANTGTVYARTRWDPRAIWFVAECQRSLDVDHRQPKAGNFVLSRGVDDAIVDPSPYGSVSTLTSNAPTVASAQLPADYIPSQGAWSEKVAWDWATQTRSGVVAVRCDYSDAYRFQSRRSDVPDAVRDLVLLPSAAGTDAVLVIVDRASTTAENRPMNLRFRVAGGLSLDAKAGRAEKTIGATKLVIANIARTGGQPSIGRTAIKDCFKDTTAKGRCDASRFETSDFRLELPGPEPRAVHAISVADPALTVTTTPLSGEGWAGIQVTGVRDAAVVWPTRPGSAFSYTAAKGTHVILDAPATSAISAKPAGTGCTVDVTAGGAMTAKPVVLSLDAACAITIDAEAASAASAVGTRPTPPAGAARSPRSGCCGAQSTPGSPIAMTLVVLAIVLRRKRREIGTVST
ncbi:hypothetical protein BH11MYX3_BH11MYX3_24870 [soil metagenome]